jgi:hypothetical protein
MISIWIAVIAVIPPTITSIASLVFHLRNRKSIQEINVNMNGRFEQLLNAAIAQGRQIERDEQEKKANPTT